MIPSIVWGVALLVFTSVIMYEHSEKISGWWEKRKAKKAGNSPANSTPHHAPDAHPAPEHHDDVRPATKPSFNWLLWIPLIISLIIGIMVFWLTPADSIETLEQARKTGRFILPVWAFALGFAFGVWLVLWLVIKLVKWFVGLFTKKGHGHEGGHHKESIWSLYAKVLGTLLIVVLFAGGIIFVIIRLETYKPSERECNPVAVNLEVKGKFFSHTTPFSEKILTGFKAHCVEAVDIWVPNCELSAGGTWNLYDPKGGYTNLPAAKFCGDKSKLVYKFRRHVYWWQKIF